MKVVLLMRSRIRETLFDCFDHFVDFLEVVKSSMEKYSVEVVEMSMEATSMEAAGASTTSVDARREDEGSIRESCMCRSSETINKSFDGIFHGILHYLHLFHGSFCCFEMEAFTTLKSPNKMKVVETFITSVRAFTKVGFRGGVETSLEPPTNFHEKPK